MDAMVASRGERFLAAFNEIEDRFRLFVERVHHRTEPRPNRYNNPAAISHGRDSEQAMVGSQLVTPDACTPCTKTWFTPRWSVRW